jgi:hypothetical protein
LCGCFGGRFAFDPIGIMMTSRAPARTTLSSVAFGCLAACFDRHGRRIPCKGDAAMNAASAALPWDGVGRMDKGSKSF